ncbi:2-amino-4-hydroxy-6-hydroxymethyldihydropteridine diphosphokinase [Brevirhabdus sp.]|uniref:2-amino-4-hydroxy-6- hydroxymethyldihydropteridine diphosphokinase n=1 Tax=Brevirhabdus sp. TaxID=2004514 RepID=UPI004059B0A1
MGSNATSPAGSPTRTLLKAVLRLGELGLSAEKISKFYRTSAFPVGSGPDFVNAALRIRCDATAQDMLKTLHRVEAEFGRQRQQRWGPRTLDLDLVAAGELILPDPQTLLSWMELPLEEQKADAPGELILPHPRLQDRAFVLVPMRDVAPDWRHPLLGQGIDQMIARLPRDQVADVQQIATPGPGEVDRIE